MPLRQNNKIKNIAIMDSLIKIYLRLLQETDEKSPKHCF